jgi:hypothetical protein
MATSHRPTDSIQGDGLSSDSAFQHKDLRDRKVEQDAREVRAIRKRLTQAGQEPTEKEITKLLELGPRSELHWPDVLVPLIDRMIEVLGAEDSARSLAAQTALQMLLSLRAGAGHSDQGHRSVQDAVVERMLLRFVRERQRLSRKEPAQDYRLAMLIAACFGAIQSADLRSQLIYALEDLIMLDPETYGDPFIEDLVVIYRNMNLRAIEAID